VAGTEGTIEEGTGRRAALAARLRDHHGVSLEQVLAEVAYLRDEGDSVIAGGSLVYGLGNHLSDLDLLIAGATTMESSRVPLEQWIGSLRIDVWKLAEDLIEETFERAERALADPGALHDSFGDSDHETEPKLLHRIAFGVVIDGAGLELSPGRDHRAVAADLVVREYAERLRASALLARLALRADRPLAAIVNARQAVEEALNAAIANRGLPYSGDKWLGERLLHDAPDLGRLYEPFACLPDFLAAEAEAFVEEALATCAQIWALDLTVAGLAPAARWRSAGLRAMEVGSRRLLLSTRFDAVWDLDPAEAETWRRLSAAVGAEDEAAVWALADCDPEQTDLCLRLHEWGLLDLQWADGVTSDLLEPAPGSAG